MNPIEMDCRGLPCPQPIMRLAELFKAGAPADIEVIVDNQPAVENVRRFLEQRGYGTDVATGCSLAPGKDGSCWYVTGHCDNPPAAAAKTENAPGPAAQAGAMTGAGTAPEPAPATQGRTLVMLVSPVLGHGDDALGARLMRNFLATLPEMGNELWRIVMLNGGVTLAAADSPVLDQLKALEAAGVGILVCGTCLEHFGLTAQKAVGETTNMLDIVTSMQLAGKVIRP